jgi:hypothetical protein
LGVPYWLAHQLVKACDWSRPVKNASLRGSSRRIAPSHSVAVAIASSQPISRNSPLPRGPTRRKGRVRRAGE